MYKASEFRFSPVKKYIFANKERSISLEPKHKVTKLAPRQANFNHFHPVKPFKRFGKSKIYNTGLDPESFFLDFIKKDADKPYKRNISPIITKDTNYIPTKPLKWGVGCTKSCHRDELVPKHDPYKDYYILDKSSDDDNSLAKTYLPTDHISIREPKITRTIDPIDNNKNFPYLKIKGQFNSSSNSNTFWAPRNDNHLSKSNKSSVKYNIINNKDDEYFGKDQDTMLNKTLFNKRKGIEEFVFSQRPFAPNFNQTFLRLMKENGDRFRKYKGIFSELYDSAHKNGNIFIPFHERDDEKKNNNNNNKIK